MVDVYTAARRAQESRYRDRCTVFEYRDVTDRSSNITRKAETVLAEDVPCRLSFELLYGVEPTDTAPLTAQRVKLFVSPELRIPAGCRVQVRLYSGELLNYGSSGVPALYPTHQEIRMEPYEKWTVQS